MLRIENLLSREIGLLSRSLGSAAIESAVRTRMQSCRSATLDDYFELLQHSAAERHALVEDIVVSETWFFRDEQVFRALAEHATSAWRRAHPDGILRVLCLPCATGEEPYSVAITLLEAGLAPNRFMIQGVDVSARPLKIAGAALYGKNSFRGPLAPQRARYFEEKAQGLEVIAAARSSVVFVRGNVLDPLLVPAGQRYDVIFCRNLLIYLDASARTRVLDNLCTWLTAEGILFTGHAEAIETMDARFERMNHSGHCTYIRRTAPSKAAPKRKSLRAAAPAPTQTKPTPPKLAKTTPSPLPKAAAEPKLATSRADSLALVTELADRGDVGAAAACERHLEEHGPSAEAYGLLGTIRAAAGNSQAAQEAFTRALYLDQTYYPALIHLALLHEQRGESAAAANYRRRAERARPKRAVP